LEPRKTRRYYRYLGVLGGILTLNFDGATTPSTCRSTMTRLRHYNDGRMQYADSRPAGPAKLVINSGNGNDSIHIADSIASTTTAITTTTDLINAGPQ